MRELGTFVLAKDVKRASGAAAFAAALVFSAFVGAGLGTSRWSVGLLAPVAALAVWLVERRRRQNAIQRGAVLLDEGHVVLRRGDRTIHRVPVKGATITGRTLLDRGQRARVQIVVAHGERALVAQLAVAFQPEERDEDGPISPTIELDRTASRAFDAWSRGAL